MSKAFLFLVAGALAYGAPIPRRASVPPLNERKAETFSLLFEEFSQRLLDNNYSGIAREVFYAAGFEAVFRAAGVALDTDTAARIRAIAKEPVDARRDFFSHLRRLLGDRPELEHPTDINVARIAMQLRTDPAAEAFDLRRSLLRKVTSCTGFTFHDRTPFEVLEVYPGTAAQRAGLLPGDQIMNHWDQHCASEEFGAPNASLTVFRQGTGKVLTLSLVLFSYPADYLLGVSRTSETRWNYFLDRKKGIVLLRLSPNSSYVARRVSEALVLLRKQGMRALILDLRGRPEGFRSIDAGQEQYPIDTAQLFVDAGPLTVSKVRGTKSTEVTLTTKQAGEFHDLPMSALVNHRTTGANELIAAILQGRGRAELVGSRTAGNTRRVWTWTDDDNAFHNRQIFGEFFGPHGESLRKGLAPNHWVPFTVSYEENLQKQWDLFSLRPFGSTFALTLDDLSRDVALTVAAREIGRQLPPEN